MHWKFSKEPKVCYKCQKPGHIARFCHQGRSNDKNNKPGEKANIVGSVFFFNSEETIDQKSDEPFKYKPPNVV